MKMEDCTVEENVQIAKDTYKMKIKGNFVKECRTPGQFVNIRIGDGREHVLRRPISISEIDRGENLVTIIYRIVGEGTKFMANIKKGNEIDVMGPLGRGYDVLSLKKGQTALLVGGGIGVPPLYELAKQFNKRDMLEDGEYPVINGGISPSGYIDMFNSEENTITVSQGGASAGFVNFIEQKFWLGAHAFSVVPDDDIINPLHNCLSFS